MLKPIFKFIFIVSLTVIFAVPMIVGITYLFIKNGCSFNNFLRRITDFIMPIEIGENDDNPPPPPKNKGNNILFFPESKQPPKNVLFFPQIKDDDTPKNPDKK